MRTIHGATRSNSFPFRLFSLTLIVFSISFASFVSIRAQSGAPVDTDNQSEDIKVARISLIHGILSMMRGDDPDWFDVNVNMPVQTGDRLYTNDDGRAELQLGSNFFVRLDSKTGMDILELSSERAQLRMFSGSLVINLRKQPKQNVEIDTPSGAVTLSEAGEFRINVVSDIKTEVIVWRGDAKVFSENDIVVRTGQRLVLITGENPSAEITEMLAADNWDKWNQQRDYQLSKEAQSLDYIADNQSVEGAEDLTEYGNWTDTAEYGEVWTPSDVDSDWAPYQDGGWIWRDPCGWTWVSSEPWGWAPYHYGRWTVIGGRWCWVPGSDRHYAPAVVGFLNHGTKGIGWVPLAPGDKYNPARAKGHALDSNGVPYLNQKFRNGTSIATREGFTGGKSYRHRGPNSEPGLGTGRVVGAPPIVPTRASLATNSGGRTNPLPRTPSYFNRTVVTRNNDVPVVRSFTDKVAEIKANGGAPVSAVKLTPSGARATRQLIPENSPTKQIAGGGQTQQPRGVAGTSPVPQPLRSGSATGAQQTNTNPSHSGGLNTRGNSPQRQGGTQENQGAGQQSQGNVYRPQTGIDQPQSNPRGGQIPVQGTVQQQPLTQKPLTPPSQSDGNINRPPTGRTTARETEKTHDNNRQQTQQQQPEQQRPQKPQAPDQQEQRRQQQQERDLQLQQQKEQESQRQQREREQQQQEQDRRAQQQKEQESQRQQREREQQQQEQDRQAQQQKEQESQRQQREREQQQQEQDRQAQQQREQENQRQQRDRDQQQETDRRRASQGEQERQRQQQAEQERQRQQQADQERQRQQQAEQERQRQQQADQERQRQQQAEQERQRQQQADQERQRQQQAEQERQQQQQAEQERQRQQQADQERQRQQQEQQRQQEQERQRQQQEQERQRQQQQPVKKDPPGGNL